MSTKSVDYISPTSGISTISSSNVTKSLDSLSFEVNKNINPSNGGMGNVPITSTNKEYITELIKKKWDTITNKEHNDPQISSIGIKNHNNANVMNMLENSLYLPGTDTSVSSIYNNDLKYYNRFKIEDINSLLQRGFGHVFFVKPSCNILDMSGKLNSRLVENELFSYAYKNSPNMLKELSKYGSNNNSDFMLSLSNNVIEFDNQDEYIDTDEYGGTWTGYNVSYGKTDIKSKTSNDIDLTFNDDRNLHIYQTIRLWVEYISNVYRGIIPPDKNDIWNKIMDYAGSIYYIITAEDGETILFWTKYYGVFPTTIPSSQLGWNKQEIINFEKIRPNIKFRFSWKDDFNPYIIKEFNYNAHVGTDMHSMSYMPTYDPKLLHPSATLVGTPFITTESDDESSYYFKLKFNKPDKLIR